MSTNTNNLPSVEALQELANQFFQSLPGEVPKEISLDPYEHPRATGFAKSLTGESIPPVANQPADAVLAQSGIQPFVAPASSIGIVTVPPSASGIGISSSTAGIGALPSIANHTDYTNISPLESHENNNAGSDSHPNFSSNNNGGIPSSVAGSGASPSYVHQQENFSIKEPVTSFPDNNIDKEKAAQNPHL